MHPPLLIEIACEEIPARMIAAAAADLRSRLVALLDQAALPHGPARCWGGARRIAVRVEEVAPRASDRAETVLGPPAKLAFGADGRPTPAGAGFARKQGVDPSVLTIVRTEKGEYAGFAREVAGRTVGEALASALPAEVAAMSFPKTMRWGDGSLRWVRPVHGLLALHGADVIDLEILGARSGRTSPGHRFLAPGPVTVPHADAYVDALREARVLVDPEARRSALRRALDAAAAGVGGEVVPDDALLDEVQDLVEWPGVVVGRFDPSFLDLPSEILVTTLRHHQKSFSIRGAAGLLPAFLSVANTDRDPAGHVRRGNEWVVVGRLDDARFFWNEDRKRPLASRLDDLAKVTFHKRLGTYREKADRIAQLAGEIARRVGLAASAQAEAREAGMLAKADLVTGLVGEFPELQGVIGGLLLRAEGRSPTLVDAIAGHYKPVGADDTIPPSEAGCVVALADRLDSVRGLIEAGEAPTGSRDPFGLRRAAAGIFRISSERSWPLSMSDLFQLCAQDGKVYAFIQERLDNWLADHGFRPNEILAVRRPKVSPTDFDQWAIGDILTRLEVVRTLRGRGDFSKLVELTKRVDNILAKQPEVLEPALASGVDFKFVETHESALTLARALEAAAPGIVAASGSNDFRAVVDRIGTLVEPVAKFFDDVLVLDADNPAATRARCELLAQVRSTVTRDLDIRELAGQADSKP